MKKIKFGVVGLGNQGTHYIVHLFNEGKIANGEVVAVSDNNPKKWEILQERLPNNNFKYFRNYIDMLDSGLCDAVLVETPHYLHPEIVIECLKRDINVICDKPAGVYTKQVEEMNAVAKTSNAHFAVLFNQRTNCLYRKMREIIASGGIGELQRVTWIITDWFRTQAYYNGGSWRATWAGEGGGVLINQCPHQIDLLQWVLGEMPKKVRAICHYGKWHDIEVEDDVTVYLEYENGATGIFITSTGEAPGTNRFEVSGTKGKLLCEGDKLYMYENERDAREHNADPECTFGGPKWKMVEVETDGENPQHAGIINNFANSLLGKEDFFVDGTEGIHGVELMNAIELSGWLNGEVITLPIDADKYLSELNKRRAVSKQKTLSADIVMDTSNSFGSKVK